MTTLYAVATIAVASLLIAFFIKLGIY